MAHAGHPVLCDKLYGGEAIASVYRLMPSKEAHKRRLTGDQSGHEIVISRQALHAHRLAIAHPVSGERLHFEAPLPGDMQRVLDLLSGPK